MMKNMDLFAILSSMADEKYRLFSCKLLPDAVRKTVIGVRLPQLRTLAKNMVKNGAYSIVLNSSIGSTMEEKMVYGMLIGYAPLTDEQKFEYLLKFVPKIDCWSVCDCVCVSLKFKDKKKLWAFLLKNYAKSTAEFELRFVLVMALNHFLEEKYLEDVLRLVENISSPAYYVVMAQAWLLSMLYVKFPQSVLDFLTSHKVSTIVYAKTLQKILESRQISQIQREKIKNLRYLLKIKATEQ